MSLYLRWGGAILLIVVALYISREYEKYLGRRISEYRGLCSMIAHVEEMISKYLAHGDGLWRDFRCDALEKCGFLPAVREGKGLYSALESCSDKMSLSREAKERLSQSFKKLGRGYMDGELDNLSLLKDNLAEECERESIAAEKNIKVARALLLGGALTLVIMAI